MRTLRTKRLVLRPMTAEDAPQMLGLFGDPGFMAAFDSQPFGERQVEHWVARNLTHQSQHGYGLWTVELRESGEMIGDCGLQHMQIDGIPEVELGYDLRRDHWGQGLATEAARAVMRHAYDALGIQRLVSLVRTSNTASARVAEKVGMQRERYLTVHGVAYALFARDAASIAVRNRGKGARSAGNATG